MKIKYAVRTFLVSAAALTALRLLQLIVMIEPRTGFYYADYSAAGPLIGVAVFIVCALMMFFCWRSPSPPLKTLAGSRVMMFAAAAAGLGYLYNCAVTFTGAFTPGVGDYKIMAFISSFLALLTAACFSYQAYISKIRKTPVLILPAVAMVWTIFELTRGFMMYTGIANISENLFDVVLLCAQLLFWSFHGKLFNGGDAVRKKFLPFFIGMAFISSLLGILVSLPRFLAILAGQSDKLPASALPGFFPLAVTVYALCCLIELSVIKIPVLARLLSGSGKAPERRPAAEPTPPLSRAKPAPHVRRVYRLREKTGIRMELAAYARRQVDALNLNDPAFERIAPNATSGEIPEDQFAVSAALMDEIDRIEPSEDDLAFLDQLDKWADS